MVSSSLTSLPVNGAGAGLSTYSGRAMESGTGRRGEIAAGAIPVGVRRPVEAPVVRRSGGWAAWWGGGMAKYWSCVKPPRVGPPDVCPPIDRLGPFATEEEAE